MRDVGRCAVIPLRSMRERAYNFSAHFRVGRHAPYCTRTNDFQYCHATRIKLKLETAYHPQREILRMRSNPACVSFFLSLITVELSP
jgi:hypothetical protein